MGYSSKGADLLLHLFLIFIKVNLLSTSGPASVGLLYHEVVGNYVTESEFVQAVGLSSVLPGSDGTMSVFKAVEGKAVMVKVELGERTPEHQMLVGVEVDAVTRRKLTILKRAIVLPAPAREGAAEELSTKDIKVRVLHEGTGTITESDILLASASEAIIRTDRARASCGTPLCAARPARARGSGRCGSG